MSSLPGGEGLAAICHSRCSADKAWSYRIQLAAIVPKVVLPNDAVAAASQRYKFLVLARKNISRDGRAPDDVATNDFKPRSIATIGNMSVPQYDRFQHF